jgi:hypothetical protein
MTFYLTRRLLLCALFWLLPGMVHGDSGEAAPGAPPEEVMPCDAIPFSPGERLVFAMRYGPFNGGELTLEVRSGPDSGKPRGADLRGDLQGTWHLHGRAVSASWISVFYAVDDTIEAWVEGEGFLPRRLEIRVDETGERGTREVEYDHDLGEARYRRNRVYHRKKGPSVLERRDDMTPGSQDGLSLLYYLRCRQLAPGMRLEVPLHENGKNRLARISVEAVERVKTPLGSMAALPLEIDVVVEGKLANERALRLWLSADPRRLPVRLEAELAFGSLKGVLQSMEPGG